MRKNFALCFIVTIFLLFSFVESSGFLIVWGFSGGDGSPGNPYVITTVEHLQAMKDKLDAHYVLGNDIDASDTSTWNGGLGFDPIGTFTGHLDGQGYVIHNLHINRPSEDYVGLFGFVGSGAEITNVGLVDVDIMGKDATGGFVGGNYGTISSCYVTGSVSGNVEVGGFVGGNDGTITNSYFTGSVSGNLFVGGFAGSNVDAADTYSFDKCYSTGSVSGNNDVGGFVGLNDYNIWDCYSTASVNGDKWIGGFVGYNYEFGDITYSYSAGSVSGNQDVGGFAGDNFPGSSIWSCYWDMDASGMPTSDGGMGKTTAQMKQQAIFITWGDPPLPWNFFDIWCIGENVTYPHLRYMPEQVTDSATGSGNVFFDVEDPYALADLTAVNERSLPLAGKPDLVFPHGFFSFTIIGLADGASVTITITFPSDIATEYWKYHEPEGWINVTSLLGSNDGDNVLTLTITDGELGDDDNEVNSIIVDQGGPGQPKPEEPNGRAEPVGGDVFTTDKLVTLTPYLLVALAIVTATSLLIKKRKH